VSAVAAPDGFFRTPLQVLLLGYATFGLYGVYWLIRGRRIAEIRLGQRTPYWWYLFWLVPIVAIFSGVKSANIIENRVAISGAPRPTIPFGVMTFAFFILDALWRLPDPYWLISICSPIFVAAMHVSLAKAERIDYPSLKWPRLTAWEWAIMILGGLVMTLGIVGSAVDVPVSSQQFTIGCGVAIAVSIFAFATISVGHHARGSEQR
jgi:hypothetical protein